MGLPSTPRRAALASAVLAATLGLSLAGCASGSTHRADASSRPPAGARTDPASRLPSPSPSPSPLPTLPGGGRTLFPATRVVAYYGAAGEPALGVLGSGPPDQVWPRLAAQAAPYAVPGRPVLPAFELIATVAQHYPGPDGMYRYREPDALIDEYLAAARKHHALLILDVQPGRADFLTEAQHLARWLELPDVALAIDPEWKVGPGVLPGTLIGSTDAATINAISGWLDGLTVASRLPQKLLLIHQFTVSMIQNKPAVVTRPHLAITFNMDGFGGREAKLSKYRMLAADPRFGLGLKLFYRQDVGIFGPADVLALRPAPDVVEYQ